MKFTLKEIIFAAIVAAAMNVISFFTVVLVLGIPIPGIRTIVVAPFYGILYVMVMKKIKNNFALSLTCFFAGVPLAFISPGIFVFTLFSGVVGDIFRFIFFKDMDKRNNLIIVSSISMGAMMVIATVVDIFMLNGTTMGEVFSNPILQITGLALTMGLGALGGFIGTKVSKEFKQASLIR